MMISVEHVWKRYRRQGYRTLREDLSAWCRRPLRSGLPVDHPWVLRDVSLAVAPGEAFGIVGPNGSGKSTLLKLLAGISRPTQGRVEVRGRVASLLELGAGFHPELSGRENVLLNGVILGLTRREVQRRLDEIAAFAEVEAFLDLPLKRYSSGMVVRLGFAVAAHADADVLLMDEVLAVGDARFQQRCIDRMVKLRDQGVTFVFVSHNLPMVALFCGRTIWLQAGAIAACGPGSEVVQAYQRAASRLDSPGEAEGGAAVAFEAVRLCDEEGKERQSFRYRDPLCIRIVYRCRQPVTAPAFTLTIRGGEGRIFQASMLLGGERPRRLEGSGELECRFPALPLAPGRYHIVGSVRGSDDMSYLMPPQVIADFAMESDLSAYGWREEAAAILAEAAPVVLPHEWRFRSSKGMGA